MQAFADFLIQIYNRPSILDGSIQEIVDDAKRIEAEGAQGFDLLAYRYKYQDKVNELIEALMENINVPIVSAGSINSQERLQETEVPPGDNGDRGQAGEGQQGNTRGLLHDRGIDLEGEPQQWHEY